MSSDAENGPQRTPVAGIADRYVERLAAHEPAAAQAIGRGPVAPFPDASPEWYAERHTLDGAVRDELVAVDEAGLSSTERALRAAMIERLESTRSLDHTGFTTRLLAPLATPVHRVREAFDSVVVTDDEAGDEGLVRLEAAPSVLADYERTLRESRSAGDRGEFTGSGVAAARQVRGVAEQVASWIDPSGLDVYRSIAHADALSPARARRLEAAAAAMTEASERFRRFLVDDLLPSAPSADAVGEDVYAATASSFLGARLDLDEISAYGWDELHRLVAEATVVSRRLGAEGIRDAARRLDADESRLLRGVPVIRAWLAERMGATIDALDGDALDMPPHVRDVDCIVSEAASGVFFYSPGAPDGSRRPRVVWTLPGGTDTVSTWRDVTSLHHEGVPGHHYEHAVAHANVALHPWQRYLCHVHGYAEGWAHYAEQLAGDVGLVRDDAERLGLLLGQIWRSVRIVADIGLHTGRPIPATPLTDEARWTPSLARDLLTDVALVDPVTARFEVDRYLGWPGQALAFKVGAKLWTDTRDAARSQRGDGFDARRFHADALALGPMGLDPLRKALSATD
ncbi:uncharacterized protein (DUF885 family) [Labedella gwakjiensis]|uniref:DUF885 domain-containing protein n=1 Tax=Labedella gwakjiensis TaxID=390269 RepID=A0A2P8GZA8_9MICO|nr:DUF885 domain-containing protein [Labedella gwakjiensis]PSL39303.1 uncharacterized protein (DUF885 family) [Labedella gwakjiensis]RUQ86276.1 DUF885 domain-containing protein [Labedella gwakjiensis]